MPAALAFSPAALPATYSGWPTCMIAPSCALCSSVPELIVTSGIFFVGDLVDRALQHVEVGDRDDHAVVVARGGLFDQARHVGDVAVRRIAVVGLDVEVLVGLFDGVLDGVPPRVRIRRVADQHEVSVSRAGGRGRAESRRQRQCRHQNPERSLALAKSHCLHLSRSVVIEGSVWRAAFHPRAGRRMSTEAPSLTTKIRPSSEALQ